MTWFMRLGVLCAVLCAVACTGNPKPLPPNEAQDGNMPPQDANVSPDGNVYQDAHVAPDAASDGGVFDGGVDGALDGSTNDSGTTDGGRADAGRFHFDAGLSVPDGGVRKRDGGPVMTPPPSQE